MTKTFTILFCCLCISLVAQDHPKSDSTTTKDRDVLIVRQTERKDTILLEKSYAARYNPRKALLYAAVLPGLGQVYNKKYWKLPLVYGGFIFVGHYMGIYQKGYTKYKLELYGILEDPSSIAPSGFSLDQLRNIVNRARRERDFMIIMMGLVYVLQMVDAHVDAHLKEFDLNPNLQVRLRPMFETDQVIGRQAGFSLTFKF